MTEFVVGLDLAAASHGALSFAHWMQQQSRDAQDPPTFVGVHVLDDVVLRRRLREADLALVAEQAEARAQQTMQLLGANARAEVSRGHDAPTGLARAASAHRAQALILGRQAPSDQPRLIALGRVARVALRQLSAPTIIVPPDLEPDDPGAGPIVVAIDSTDASCDAVDYARSLGKMLGRPVELVGVTRLPNFSGLDHTLPAMQAARDEIRRANEAEIHEAVASWDHGDLPVTVVCGYITDELVAFAKRKAAPLLVVGSRRLNMVERAFRASVGTALACVSPVPVVVVPPRERAG